jgi:hypothetical protein
MSRVAPLLLFTSALYLIASIPARTEAQPASGIPDYFVGNWTVNRDCTEAHAGAGSGHTIPGSQFRIVRVQDNYVLQVVDQPGRTWASGWKNLKLEYRSGARMSAIPADMECVPGDEASSPFLAQSGYSVSAEPFYPYEHWYTTVKIHGEKHHLLIFPRNSHGPNSAAIVLIDADAADNMQLDHDGTIIVEN